MWTIGNLVYAMRIRLQHSLRLSRFRLEVNFIFKTVRSKKNQMFGKEMWTIGNLVYAMRIRLQHSLRLSRFRLEVNFIFKTVRSKTNQMVGKEMWTLSNLVYATRTWLRHFLRLSRFSPNLDWWEWNQHWAWHRSNPWSLSLYYLKKKKKTLA
jgi:hypothetical protein